MNAFGKNAFFLYQFIMYFQPFNDAFVSEKDQIFIMKFGKLVSLTRLLLIYFTLCLVAVGCIETKNVTYFNNLPDSVSVALQALEIPHPVVKVNDQLVIQVGGENEKTVAYINQYYGSPGGLNATVDIDGNINLPRIGKIHIAGLSQDAARDTITQAYKEYLLNPIVSIKFSDFRFAVLGEIKAPGYFTMPKETVNLLEAIAMAGDMTTYARRDQVKLLRTEGGTRHIYTINFLDSSMLNSPFFYLHKDDIIYVEPLQTKQNTENFTRIFPVISSVLSVITIVFLLIKK